MNWRRWGPWLIAAAGLAAFANSLTGAFVLDDMRWIVDYPPLRQLWPPRYLADNSRPLINLTLALNYAISGTDPWSYHVVNLTIHILSALTLAGIARRITDNAGLATAVSLLWVVHPLQTQSVTYVIQRGESLMGLFYLLTLYGALRGGKWEAVAVGACAAGMMTKPIMVTAPVMVFIADALLRRSYRWKLYSALAATWLVLAGALFSGANDWERTAGYGARGVSAWDYLRTQPVVIAHYLRLVFWPDPLCLDYRWPVGGSWAVTGLVTALLVGTVVAVWRSRWVGLAGAFAWVTLLPSSSFIPIGDLAFEHRMYLPLAGVIAVVVAGLWRLPAVARAVTVAGLVLALGAVTVRRNMDYRSPVRLWEQTVAQAPRNARAHLNLGRAYQDTGAVTNALRHLAQAVALDPLEPRGRYNLGLALANFGHREAAIPEFRSALELAPDFAEAHYNLGIALRDRGDLVEARRHLERAAQLAPGSFDSPGRTW